MSKFQSITEAESAMREAMFEVNEILARDLPDVQEASRTVDMWFQVHGKNRELDLTKDILKDLEMNTIDAEIYILNQNDKKKNLADTFC